MKVRTFVMFVCMTVVPAMAMFSHRLPAGLRDVVRTRLWDPVESWVASLAKGEEKAVIDQAATEPSVLTTEPAATHDEPVGSALAGAANDVPSPPPQSSPSLADLASLGATMVETRPFDDLAGTHVAACRVAVDQAGQLHRVFQAAGRSPDEAMASLLDAVRAWKERTASGATTPRM